MRSLTFYCPRLIDSPVGDNKKVNAFWAWECNLSLKIDCPDNALIAKAMGAPGGATFVVLP